MVPLRGSREGGSVTLRTELSGKSMQVATTTALSATMCVPREVDLAVTSAGFGSSLL